MVGGLAIGGELMRRTPPRWFVWLKSGWKTGVVVLIASVSFAGAIRGFVSPTLITMTPICIAVSAVACIAIGTIAAYSKGRITLLPDSLLDEMCSNAKYVCRL